MSNQVTLAQAVNIFQQQLLEKESQISTSLPQTIPSGKFVNTVMSAVQNDPELLKADRRSLINSCMKAAADGLLADGREGALVVYKTKDHQTNKFVQKVQWMPMIAGIRKKVRNSGEISTWEVHAVYENDLFDFELGDEPYIKHKPNIGNRGELVAVYSICTLKSGEKSREVMGVDEINKIKALSKAQNGPWRDHYDEMAKKTVARRHSKSLPMSNDVVGMLSTEDYLHAQAASNQPAIEKKPEPTQRLAGRLDAIAGATRNDDVTDIDPETGEVQEEQVSSPAHSGGDDKVSGAEQGTSSQTSQKDASLTEDDVNGMGWDAASRGVNRNVIPKRVRDVSEFDGVAVHQAGWDSFMASREG